jgi:hypothetical protein
VTFVVAWKGQELDIDPVDFTGLELSEVKKRTALTFKTLIEGLRECDGDAIRALFWVAMRRTDPELKFSEFDGPPLRLFLQHFEGLSVAMDEGLGKDQTTETGENDGSLSSPSNADTPEPTISL